MRLVRVVNQQLAGCAKDTILSPDDAELERLFYFEPFSVNQCRATAAAAGVAGMAKR
jgi:hypothetical protein